MIPTIARHTAPSRAKGLIRHGLVRMLKITGLNVITSKLYYDHVHGFRSASPELDKGFDQIFGLAKDLGSFRSAPVYCEFGMFKGYSFWKAQRLAKSIGIPGLRFFGFDSFEGLPEVKGVDKEGGADFRKGQYACSLDSVKANLDKAGGVDWSNTQLVKGYFSETLTPERAQAYDIDAVGVAMIDCDLYESTVDVLAFLQGRLRDKTILIMDDWNCFDRDDGRGQRRALREFLDTNPAISLEPLCGYGFYSQAFVVSMPPQR